TTDYKKTKDGITVGYRMKADKTEYKITLTYKLEDGSLIVEADNERLSGDAVIESMDILSYMGATVNAKEGDYMILPDGCGAVVDTWNYSFEISSLSFAVYGNDSTVEATKSEYSSIAGVYGAKEGAKAFGAVITKGDAISTIKFDKATDKNKYNTVYPEFAITPTLRTQDKVYLSENSYDDSIRIVYRFLSGNIADYSGVATACREVLIREGFLSSAAIKDTEELKLNLNLTGGFDNGNKIEKATTFEQAQEILMRLKAKGVDNLSLTYKGMLSGGIDQNNIEYAGLLNGLGGKKDLAQLNEYMTTQGMELYADVQFLTAKVNQLLKYYYSAGNILKRTASAKSANPFAVFSENESYIRTLNKTDKLDKTVEELHKKDIAVMGYTINDVGSLLYTDFSKPYNNRQFAAKEIAAQLTSLRAEKKVAVSTGNFYMLKTADKITEIPITTQKESTDYYRSVPFIQIILHGTIPYSSTGLNLSQNADELLLKCIEYGCEPTYEMYYEVKDIKNEEQKSLDEKYSFEKNMNKAVEVYTKATQALEGLADERIMKQSQLKPGVYMTEYSSGSAVYVNTTDEDVEVNKIEISANSFIRIN
ncbi:MAG: hypothetical protein IJD88_06630, partial [Clostridia bacterium]|nr:hypothetical protein [Clostridia bacterium]